MQGALRLLLLDGQENPAPLVLGELERLGHEVTCERVTSLDGMLVALAHAELDVIISDFGEPPFSAREALTACRQKGFETPFIIVSARLDEEAQVEALRLGANDFVATTRLKRLGPAIARGRRDLAERRARRPAEARLRQAQKLEALGQLAGGVAHDFNNLLAVIQGHAELLTRRLAGDEASTSRLAQILEAANRGAALTRQLLTFSRRQPFEAKPLDLNSVVVGMEPMLRRLISEDIQIVTTLDERLPWVRADPTQAEQVLMNLAINARDAMNAGGLLTILTENVELRASDLAPHPEAKPGSYAMLQVADTGHGMDAETLAHVFEPFYTTKGEGKGTGLGLATVYGIVRQSGGHVLVESEPGRGTKFRVYLPSTEKPVARGALADAPASRQGGSETIVLVEDDAALRSVLRALLQEGGYTVVDGAGPEASVAAAQAHPGPIHLVLTDVVMPHMSGGEAAAHVQRAHPGARVLYMSGYARAAARWPAGLPAGRAFLQKPFTLEALLGRLREVLDGPS